MLMAQVMRLGYKPYANVTTDGIQISQLKIETYVCACNQYRI